MAGTPTAGPPGTGPGDAAARTGVLRLVLGHPTGFIGACGVAVVLVIALFGPMLAQHGPYELAGDPLTGPSSTHWLGTDNLGRDLLSRIAVGLRMSLIVALTATIIAAVVGGALGMLAGFIGGRTDRFVMRCWDVVLAFPDIILAIAITAVLGSGMWTAVLAIAAVGMPSFARLARSATRTERNLDYVLADLVAGAGRVNILLRSVLPNVAGPLVLFLMTSIPHAIILEAGLSYLGLSEQAPTPSLGAMINTARNYLVETVWFEIVPIVALFLVTVSVMLIGLRLSDALDPARRYTRRAIRRGSGGTA
ncbi:ABC transporter permease [Dactylosporangium sp. NPDC050688]|uniref:ABC transporter permease n=1 Tax=Dactylosporangium sp. NPDC050688 TaxID=3157217 RepID=UPI0033E41AC3